MKDNIEDLPALVQFAHEKSFEEICLQLMEPEEKRYEDKILINP